MGSYDEKSIFDKVIITTYGQEHANWIIRSWSIIYWIVERNGLVGAG